jgi:hypothetical protein
MAGFVLGKLNRLVEKRLVRNDPTQLNAAGGRDDGDGLGIVDAGRKLGRREAAEND